MVLGLRVDVDTYRGTRTGVPNLRKILFENATTATFFFSVGPDNMGRHLWRLLKPDFLKKMLRSNAPGLYGWDILLRGTLWPGPIIGRKAGHIIRAVADDGHETGLHAWDHHHWQTHALHMNKDQVYRDLEHGYNFFTDIVGRPPSCSAAPGWICNDTVLTQKELFPFTYNSDCRGTGVFLPVVEGKPLSCPQIPVTLPTYDEIIGRRGISAENYNDYLLSLIKPAQLNVLTIHAEVEGIICRELFVDFLVKCRQKGILIVPLGHLLKNGEQIPLGTVCLEEMNGRQGQICRQSQIAAP